LRRRLARRLRLALPHHMGIIPPDPRASLVAQGCSRGICGAGNARLSPFPAPLSPPCTTGQRVVGTRTAWGLAVRFPELQSFIPTLYPALPLSSFSPLSRMEVSFTRDGNTARYGVIVQPAAISFVRLQRKADLSLLVVYFHSNPALRNAASFRSNMTGSLYGHFWPHTANENWGRTRMMATASA